jgi:hypothetical protein
MSTTKDCPGCGRGFLKGKRVLFPMRDGRLVRKLVCLTCSSKAERVMTRVTAKPCMSSSCDNAAHMCTHCAADLVLEERMRSTTGAVEELRGMLVALRVTDKTHGGEDFIQGKIEGLESAIELLVRQGTRRSMKGLL